MVLQCVASYSRSHSLIPRHTTITARVRIKNTLKLLRISKRRQPEADLPVPVICVQTHVLSNTDTTSFFLFPRLMYCSRSDRLFLVEGRTIRVSIALARVRSFRNQSWFDLAKEIKLMLRLRLNIDVFSPGALTTRYFLYCRVP